MPICIYCKADTDLSNSHSIPDAFFRLISKKNNGSLIDISTEHDKIKRSQNSGKSRLLCKNCEAEFNRKFDSPTTNALKEWDKQIRTSGLDSRYEFCHNHLAQSFASIFWRSVVSDNEIYSSAALSTENKQQLLNLVRGNRSQTLKNCSVYIRRLYDKSAPSDGGITQEAFSQLIILPMPFSASEPKNTEIQYFAMLMVVIGFVIMIVLPRLPDDVLIEPGYLQLDQTKLFAPKLHFLDHPVIHNLAISTLSKQRLNNAI